MHFKMNFKNEFLKFVFKMHLTIKIYYHNVFWGKINCFTYVYPILWKDIDDYRRQMIKETLITVIDNAEVCKNTSVQT